MTVGELAGNLCKDVVREVYEEDGRAFIETTLPYPTGDLITLSIDVRDGDLYASDNGMTAYWLAVDGVDLTEPRQRFLESACLLHDVSFDGEAFTRRLTPVTLGTDVLALCQTIVRVSTLRYDRVGRTLQTVTDEVASLVDAKVLPRRPYVPNWTDAERDPRAANLVDYHFNSAGVASNLFVAQSQQKVAIVTGIIFFWRTQFPDFKAMCVLTDELALTRTSAERLRMAADVVVSGVARNAEQIVEFALSPSAYRPQPLAPR